MEQIQIQILYYFKYTVRYIFHRLKIAFLDTRLQKQLWKDSSQDMFPASGSTTQGVDPTV